MLDMVGGARCVAGRGIAEDRFWDDAHLSGARASTAF